MPSGLPSYIGHELKSRLHSAVAGTKARADTVLPKVPPAEPIRLFTARFLETRRIERSVASVDTSP